MINNEICNCSLCTLEFNKSDPDLDKRLEKHDIHHLKAHLHKRNTAQGKPEYY